MIPILSTTRISSGVVPFNYTTLAGWQMILDADSVSGSTGDPVGTWSGSNGTSYSATAAGAARPLLRVAELNGHKTLRFDGTNSVMTTPGSGIGAALPSAATLFIVCTLNSDNEYTLLDPNAHSSYWRFSGDGKGYNGCFRANRVEGLINGMPTTGSHIFMVRSSSSGWDIWMDGTSLYSTTGDYESRTDFDWIVGGAYPAAQLLNGDLARIAINSNVLSDANATKVFRQFGSQYGIAVA